MVSQQLEVPYADFEVWVVGRKRRHWWQRRKRRRLPCRITSLNDHPSKDVLVVGLTAEYGAVLARDRWEP